MIQTFESNIVLPSGIKAIVLIEVDPEAYGPDVLELSEVTQMGVVRVASLLEGNQRAKDRHAARRALLQEVQGVGSSDLDADTAPEDEHLPD